MLDADEDKEKQRMRGAKKVNNKRYQDAKTFRAAIWFYEAVAPSKGRAGARARALMLLC